MKRRLPIFGVFLLLLAGGAIVNVAVAWGCGKWMRPRFASAEPTSSNQFWPKSLRTTSPPPCLMPVLRWEAFGVSSQILIGWDFSMQQSADAAQRLCNEWNETAGTNPDFGNQLVQLLSERGFFFDRGQEPSMRSQAGWPLLSLCGWSAVRRDETVSSFSLRHSMITIRRGIFGTSESSLFPFQPLWPGFAINTLFYAAIIWSLFAAPGALRRRRRIKRGLCPACAYPVGTSPVCTECGTPVTVRSVESASS